MRCGRTDKIEILKLTVYPILQLEIQPVIHHAFYFDLLQRFLYLYLPYFFVISSLFTSSCTLRV